MTYLHSTDIGSHGNLSSLTCVIDHRWNCKITDYGLAHFRKLATKTVAEKVDDKPFLSRESKLVRKCTLSVHSLWTMVIWTTLFIDYLPLLPFLWVFLFGVTAFNATRSVLDGAWAAAEAKETASVEWNEEGRRLLIRHHHTGGSYQPNTFRYRPRDAHSIRSASDTTALYCNDDDEFSRFDCFIGAQGS